MKILQIALTIAILAASPLAIADDLPGPMTIQEDFSCGVCGMHPAKFIKWQTQIIFTDGSMVPFDGGKDLFKYMFNMAKYSKIHNRDDIAAIWVRDFDSGKWANGRDTVYVIGSKVMGPMGKELIPFSDGHSAGKFKIANDGVIKLFNDISKRDIKKLGGGMKMKKKM